MADYYPLLARALDAMPDRSPALRQAVYERARGALIGQLRSLDPPLSEDDIDLERNALEAAILRLEQDHRAPEPTPPPPEAPPPEPAPFVPHPANDTTDLPEPSRPEVRAPEATPPEVTSPEPAALAPEPVPTEASLPKATLPPVTAEPPEAPARPALEPAPAPSEPVVRIQARKGKAPPFVAAGPAEAGDPAGESGESAPDAASLDGAGQRQRPRIDVVAPREGRSRLLRNLAVGSVLILVIGLIAVAAFLLRDKPADLQPVATGTQENASDGSESKFADRVGGGAAPAERPAQARRSAPAASPTAVPAPSEPDLAIAQRALLYEENASGGAGAPPNTTQGRVTWRLDTVPGEQGQPLETVVRANADFPDAGLALALTLRRNLDATLPASHTIELVFTPSGTAGAQRNVQDIGLLQGKDEEGARGSPVSGLPVRVRENLFLIGLSSLPSDVERNTDILLRKNWFDVTLKFNSGLRGVIALEKGSAGTQVLQKAFDQWR
ncbi:histidine kinase [Methylobacterium sp. J-068]|uniref:histidine kinase n=1 Tax=Methylobacterium sp. J-068 TaxID=2836649 RepID=UPI001FBA3F2D|nr:histidine kinase [Methylobacterium sp. J-068]MCJ2035269.1 histidine kinase [Methylobacterium sp. J-068]